MYIQIIKTVTQRETNLSLFPRPSVDKTNDDFKDAEKSNLKVKKLGIV